MIENDSRRRFLKGVGAISAGSVLAGCAGLGGSGDTVRIGAIPDRSGPFSPWGQSSLAGAEFAVDELNASDDFDYELELLSSDSGGNPTEAASIFQRFVSQDVVSVMGMTSSDVMLRLRSLCEQEEIPQFVNTPGTKELLPEGTRYTFRLNVGSAEMIGQAFGELIEEEGYDRVGAIIADYAWGQAIKSGIEQHISPLSGVETEVVAAPVGTNDFTPFVRQLSDFDPEVMVVTGHPPGQTQIASKQFEIGLEPEITLGAGLHPQIWWDVLGEDVYRGITDIQPFSPAAEGYLSFASQFYDETEQYADQYVAIGYNAIKFIAAAISEADSTDSTTITETARSLNYQTFFNYPFSYTDWGELNQSRVTLAQFVEGAREEINPGASWHLEELTRSSRLTPPDPPEPQ
jgi:branched-chain amino acid transport system substrate-binding protein